jgi:hypothetical protein
LKEFLEGITGWSKKFADDFINFCNEQHLTRIEIEDFCAVLSMMLPKNFVKKDENKYIHYFYFVTHIIGLIEDKDIKEKFKNALAPKNNNSKTTPICVFL